MPQPGRADHRGDQVAVDLQRGPGERALLAVGDRHVADVEHGLARDLGPTVSRRPRRRSVRQRLGPQPDARGPRSRPVCRRARGWCRRRARSLRQPGTVTGEQQPARRRWRPGSSPAARTRRPRPGRTPAGSPRSEVSKISTGMFGTPWPKMLSWYLVGLKTRVDEQQRRCLAGGARDRKDRPGDDPAGARRAGHGRGSSASGSRRARRRPRAASPGTSSSTSWLERAISGSITIASATEPAKPDWPCGLRPSGRTRTRPMTIVGMPCIRSSAVRSTRRSRDPRPANSVRYSAVRTPIGAAISGRAARRSAPCRRSRGRCRRPASPTGFLVMKRQAERAGALLATP